MASNGWNKTLIVARGALLAFITLISHSGVSTAQERCDYGYVWREAFPRDYACVTPDIREQARRDNAAAASRYAPANDPDTCLTPFVWRKAFPGDKVCVTTPARDMARYENQLNAQRTSVFRLGPNLPRLCKQGFVWREASPSDYVCVEPAARQRVREENARAAANRGSNVCNQGYVWREASPSDYVCVEPAVRDQARRDNAAYNTGERLLGVVCDLYSREAVAQFHEMRARNCRFSGPRWQANYNNHSVWCQTADPRDRNGEAGARRAELRRCGGTPPPSGPTISVRLQLIPGSFNQLIVNGGGFMANEAVTVRIVTTLNLPNESRDETTPITANGLGGVNLTLSVVCPAGRGTSFAVTATGASGRTSNSAGASC